TSFISRAGQGVALLGFTRFRHLLGFPLISTPLLRRSRWQGWNAVPPTREDLERGRQTVLQNQLPQLARVRALRRGAVDVGRLETMRQQELAELGGNRNLHVSLLYSAVRSCAWLSVYTPAGLAFVIRTNCPAFTG